MNKKMKIKKLWKKIENGHISYKESNRLIDEVIRLEYPGYKIEGQSLKKITCKLLLMGV